MSSESQQPQPAPKCQRCGSYSVKYRVESDILQMDICQACAIDARECQQLGKGRPVGSMVLTTISGQR